MKVSSTPYKCAEVPISPISKSTPPISASPFFFEEYLNPEVRINKMGNEHTVNYHHSPSKLTSRMQRGSHISMDS